MVGTSWESLGPIRSRWEYLGVVWTGWESLELVRSRWDSLGVVGNGWVWLGVGSMQLCPQNLPALVS